VTWIKTNAMDLGADVSTVDTLHATHRLRVYCGVTVTCYNAGTTVSMGKDSDLSTICVWLWDHSPEISCCL
jgi:hypothetical protein